MTMLRITCLFRVILCFLCIVEVTPGMGRLYYSFSEPCLPSQGDICVEIRKCPFFSNLLDSNPIPRPRNVIKVIREHQCGFNYNTPKVCCFMPTTPQPTEPPTTTTTSRTLAPTVPTPIPHFYDRLARDTLRSHSNFKLLPTTTCGPISTSSRITGGTKVDIEEFPWMALIAYYTKDGVDFRCGGTVISDLYILTAAHCILNSTIIGVRLGEYDISATEDCEEGYCSPPVQDFYIENLIIHPKYNPKTYENDIALIQLATPANFSYLNVQPICLPVDELNDDISGKFAVVSGWGITENGYKSAVLLKASVPVLPISSCRKVYAKFAPVSNDQMCAGGHRGKDSCSGDSGGPMKYVGLVDGSPRYIQYGIVSYGPRHCGTEGQPGVYTRVANYLKWILDNIKASED